MRKVFSCEIVICRKWTYWSDKNSISATISTFKISDVNIKGYIGISNRTEMFYTLINYITKSNIRNEKLIIKEDYE